MKQSRRGLLIISLLIGLLLSSCMKDKRLPRVITTEATSITCMTAISGGIVTDCGSEKVLERGICWDTLPDPKIDKYPSPFPGHAQRTWDSSGIGEFISQLKELKPNMNYFVRAYAKSFLGVSYGSNVSFATLPNVTTLEISEITKTSALAGSDVPKAGNSQFQDRGICWGIHPFPTIDDNKISQGSLKGSMQSIITNLIPNTQYFVRGYVVNNSINYGSQKSFFTYPSDAISDVDNNFYNVVSIGSQIWMKEDLRTSHYLNGDEILTTTNNIFHITDENNLKFQWQYNDLDTNLNYKRRLYTWSALNDLRGVCPTGWHIPSVNEWNILITFLGGNIIGGSKLKEAGSKHWDTSNNSTNESGFTALPMGFRRPDGWYQIGPSAVMYWSSSPTDNLEAWYFQMEGNVPNIFQNHYLKQIGYSARCIKN